MPLLQVPSWPHFLHVDTEAHSYFLKLITVFIILPLIPFLALIFTSYNHTVLVFNVPPQGWNLAQNVIVYKP